MLLQERRKEGLSIMSPFFLFLVSSQENAMKVRSICRPLKALGIHTESTSWCIFRAPNSWVIDGLETFDNAGVLDKLKSIRQSASGDPQTIIFNDSFGHVFTSVVQNLLMEHISRLCLSDSATSQSACIT